MGIIENIVRFCQGAEAATTLPDGLRRIAETLMQLEADRATYLASFAYILSRVAHVDQHVQPEERHMMADAIERHSHLSAEQAALVADLALEQSRLFAGTEDFEVTREFGAVATHDEKLALIDCLFAVCASDRSLSVREDNEIRRVSRELRVEHADFIASRSRYRDRLEVMRRNPGHRMRRLITLGDRRIGYHDVGDGAALVLLHAFPLNADMWLPQIDAVPRGWRLIAPDLRGFGSSSGGAPLASMDDYARDVLLLLDELGITRAVVAGLSMGGYVAFALRRLAAERVRGLVMADTRPDADTDETRGARRAMQEVAVTQGSGAIADRMVGRLLGRSSQLSHPELVRRVRDLIVTNDASAIAAALDSLMARPDSTGDLAGIAQPTLILVGAEDELTPPPLSVQMHEAIAGSTLVEIPGAGHVSNLENPAAFNAALFDFLGRLTI